MVTARMKAAFSLLAGYEAVFLRDLVVTGNRQGEIAGFGYRGV